MLALENLQSHWVLPHLPTALGQREFLHAEGLNRFFSQISFLWVFDSSLDLERLKSSIVKALHDYPHAAGRLSLSDSENDQRKWRINLTNEGVSIVTGTTAIQPPASFAEFSEAFDPLPLSFAPPTDAASEPLIRFKLITWEKTGEVTLAVSWCHAIGDGSQCLRFMTAVSDYYQGLSPAITLTFDLFKDTTQILQPQEFSECIKLAPAFSTEYTFGEYIEKYTNMLATTQRIDLRFTAKQLDSILKQAKATGATEKITEQDALVSYLVTVFNRSFPVSIKRVTNVINLRGPEVAVNSLVDYSACGNAMIVVTSPDFTSGGEELLGSVASSIRRTITHAREPEYANRLIALTSHIFANVDKGILYWVYSPDDEIQVNNLSRWPKGTQHFGFSNPPRIHWCDAPADRYIRIFPATPVRSEDGSWKTTEGGVELYFSLKTEYKEKFLAIVKADMEKL